MTRSNRLSMVITSRISRFGVAAVTIVTAAFIALGGFSTVGAQAAGTYDCGTYGAGNYDETDCSDTPASTGTTGSGTSSGSSGSSSSSSGSSTGSSSGSSSSTSKSTTGTSGTTSATTSTPVLLNDFTEYTAETGKSLSFKVGDVINFNLKGEKHTITIKTISAGSLVVTIASTPTDVTIPINQTTNYDVDQDGTADIAITFSQAASDVASATAAFRSLAVSSTTETTPATTGSATDNSAGGTTATTTDSSSGMWWIWIIPIIIGLGLLIWAVVRILKRRAQGGGGNNFSGPNFG